MVHAYHVIFSTYGFWLPNDPRGSGSDRVAAPHLQRFGPATNVQTRHSVASECHDHVVRTEAKKSLKYPPVIFDGSQAGAVAKGFAEVLCTYDYPVYACAILPEHVHLVIGQHAQTIERIVAHLKRGATLRLFEEDRHPLMRYRGPRGSVPSPWSKRAAWIVYLNDEQAVRHRIKYVQENPLQEGKPRQHWGFVKPFRPELPPVSPQGLTLRSSVSPQGLTLLSSAALSSVSPQGLTLRGSATSYTVASNHDHPDPSHPKRRPDSPRIHRLLRGQARPYVRALLARRPAR